MNHKVLILYRENNFFTSIEEFINTYSLNDYELVIYNCTDQEKLLQLDDINSINIIKTDQNIETIIKSIYHENNFNNCIILDTCIKYDELNMNLIMEQTKSYCLIHCNNFKLPIILSKTVDISDIDILIDYNREYNDYIVCEGEIDSLFYKNFFSKLNVDHLILASILNEDIDNIGDFRLVNEKSKIYFKIFKLYYIDDVIDSKIIEILTNKDTDLHIIFILIERILKPKTFNTNIINLLIDNFNTYSANTPFVILKNYDHYVIYEYLIQYFISKPLFIVSDIPNWVLTGHNMEITKYYPSINSSKEPLTLPLILGDNILLEDISTVKIGEDQIDITNKGFICHTDKILIVKSITPLGYSVLNSEDIIICYNNHLHYREYLLRGHFINFNNYLLGLMEEKNKSYRLVILNPHDLKLIHISNNFIISDSLNAISLYIDDEELYIIASVNSEMFKCKIDMDTVVVDILYNKNILSSSPFSFNIELKNSIGVKIINFNLVNKHTYKNYTFYNLPSDQKYFINIEFNPKQKILQIDDKLVYINKFILLNDKVDNDIPKKSEIYFHESAKNTEFYTKCIEMRISTSDLYKECKYYVIAQEAFEKLNCLELSNIITNKCLIISLIDEKLLES